MIPASFGRSIRAPGPRKGDGGASPEHENARRFTSLIETGPSVVVCLSSNFRILQFSRSAERLYGQPCASVLGQDYLKLFIPEIEQETVAAAIQRALAGLPTQGYKHSIRTPDGDKRVLLWNVSPILDVADRPDGVIAVGQDVTGHEQAEQALIEQKRQLRMLTSELALAGQQERRRVAIGLHDQVGQALAMAKLKLDCALGSELSGPVQRTLEESRALLNQSIQATRSLTFRLGSAVLQELGIKAALQQLVEWFDTEYVDTQFAFSVQAWDEILGEDQALMLYDIARELLFNAARYAGARTVRLDLQREEDEIRITIKDDGIGFDTSCIEKGLSADGGFGYFSIRERLACIGGELELESELGCGTSVVVVLRLADLVNPGNISPAL